MVDSSKVAASTVQATLDRKEVTLIFQCNDRYEASVLFHAFKEELEHGSLKLEMKIAKKE